MGEKERGIPDQPLSSPKSVPPVTVEITSNQSPVLPPSHWTSSLWRAVYDKWRWGAFLAFAVLISRLSSK